MEAAGAPSVRAPPHLRTLEPAERLRVWECGVLRRREFLPPQQDVRMAPAVEKSRIAPVVQESRIAPVEEALRAGLVVEKSRIAAVEEASQAALASALPFLAAAEAGSRWRARALNAFAPVPKVAATEEVLRS
jgi:hypothetical protein